MSYTTSYLHVIYYVRTSFEYTGKGDELTSLELNSFINKTKWTQSGVVRSDPGKVSGQGQGLV